MARRGKKTLTFTDLILDQIHSLLNIRALAKVTLLSQIIRDYKKIRNNFCHVFLSAREEKHIPNLTI